MCFDTHVGILVDAIADANATSFIEDIEQVVTRWSNYDPNGTGMITLDDLGAILRHIPPPVGFKDLPDASFYRIRHSLRNLQYEYAFHVREKSIDPMMSVRRPFQYHCL
jgi:hypothetical protein